MGKRLTGSSGLRRCLSRVGQVREFGRSLRMLVLDVLGYGAYDD